MTLSSPPWEKLMQAHKRACVCDSGFNASFSQPCFVSVSEDVVMQ